jgi:hypothetical protein
MVVVRGEGSKVGMKGGRGGGGGRQGACSEELRRVECGRLAMSVGPFLLQIFSNLQRISI